MATERITKKQKYEMLKAIPAVAENEMLVELIDKEIESLEKKNGTVHKPTAQQVENAKIKTAIYDGMAENKSYTITDIIKEIDECNDLTNQRVSALVNQMVEDNKIEKIVDKRKSYFKKIVSED